jgi:hypothetical protein
LLKLICGIFQLLQLLWREILDGDVQNVTDIRHLDFGFMVPLGVPKSMLTQNLHPTSSTQQAEQANFTREKIPRRASQFFLKINKRQSS